MLKTNGQSGEDARLERQRLLTLPLILEEGRAPRLFAHLLYLTSGFVAVMLVWATVTEMRELTIAPGEIKPSGSEKLVQHLEGGMVAGILAREGEVVAAGAPLVRLQPIAASADLGKLKVQAAGLKLKIERLRAALEDREPDFGAPGRAFPKLAANERHVLNAGRQQFARERDGLKASISEKEAEIRSSEAQAASLARQLSLQEEQVALRKDLVREGYVSRANFLEVKRVLEATKASWIAMNGRLEAARDGLNAARSALRQLAAKRKQSLSAQRAEAAAELAEVAETIAKHSDRVKRLVVRAPVGGVIQELVPKSPGEVIKPGDIVARIVPLDQELVAEVQIQPKDIGYIKVGNPVEVKITTYDPAKFGGIKGTVRRISASTFQTERGEPYYKASIALSRNYVGLASKEHLVLPGMVVNAEIITGAKSLTRYLLKPVYRSVNMAFSER